MQAKNSLNESEKKSAQYCQLAMDETPRIELYLHYGNSEYLLETLEEHHVQ